MTPDERDQTEEIRTVLTRQGIAVDDGDLAAITKMVAASRAGLARARAAVADSPEVPHGFVPPAPPDEAAPHA